MAMLAAVVVPTGGKGDEGMFGLVLCALQSAMDWRFRPLCWAGRVVVTR